MPGLLQCLLYQLDIGLQHLPVIAIAREHSRSLEEVIFAQLELLCFIVGRAAALNHLFVELVFAAAAAGEVTFDALVLALVALSSTLPLGHLRSIVMRLTVPLSPRLSTVADIGLRALQQSQVEIGLKGLSPELRLKLELLTLPILDVLLYSGLDLVILAGHAWWPQAGIPAGQKGLKLGLSAFLIEAWNSWTADESLD